MQTRAYKAEVGAGSSAETFLKSELLGPKKSADFLIFADVADVNLITSEKVLYKSG